ncbi:hypothetical protein Athai_10530 [Actinocatenispora thailandica]|uniref:Uncharacterized protein n=1 Tax=Actinocatenispora thailandica TaxID=227318 RepID=A0A7R7DKS0_9ACTN|nr:hypothetical protein Athai_10530 [Actinocatenispora thailandica]
MARRDRRPADRPERVVAVIAAWRARRARTRRIRAIRRALHRYADPLDPYAAALALAARRKARPWS